MRIDRTNYEIYFLDYIDGNLPVNLIDQFLDFLEKNQDLKEQLQSVLKSPVTLPDEKIMFKDKKSLLKSELTGTSDFDYQAIAWIEGDLDKKEEKLFMQELHNDPRKKEALNMIKTLRLSPQQDIIFPHKDLLLKKNKKRNPSIWTMSVAALLIMGLLIAVLFQENQKESISVKNVAGVTPNRQSGEKPASSPQAEGKETQPAAGSRNITAQAAIPKPATDTPLKQLSPKAPEKTPVIIREEEPMAALQPIEAEILPVMNVEMKKMPPRKYYTPEDAEYTKLTDYLAQKLLDVPKGEAVTLAGIATAGLQVADYISHNKFNIEKGEKGHIKEISFNSTLFGFSIPVKKNR
jgi:hypothetical protein